MSAPPPAHLFSEENSNYSEPDLTISQLHSESEEDVINNCLEFINKGYSPLFMKINNYKPLFFQVDKHVTLKLMLKIYVKNIPDFDIRILNGIKFIVENVF